MSDFETKSPKAKKKGWGLFGAVAGAVGGVTSVVGSVASAVGEGVGITTAELSDGDDEDEDFNDDDDLVSVASVESDSDDDDEASPKKKDDSLRNVSSEAAGGEGKRRVDVTLKSHMKLDASGKLPIAGSTMEWRRRADLAAYLVGRKDREDKREEAAMEGNDDAAAADEREKYVWCPGLAENFNLRVGPNYKKTGAKAPSGPALYDLMGMDIFYSDERIENIGSQVKLPEEWTSFETNHPDVPPVFVVNGQVPEVSLGSSVGSFFVDKSDGPGWNYVMYFRVADHVAEQLKEPENASPAVKLLVRYCQNAHIDEAYADSSSEWYGRFKIVPIVENLEDLNLPAFINGYNAKPALIAKCGKFFKEEGNSFMGFDANVHAFGGLARSALGVIDVGKMVMEWGVCFESREEEEMPEALLGCNYLVYALQDYAVYWQKWGDEDSKDGEEQPKKCRNQTLGVLRKRQRRRATLRRASTSSAKSSK
jgi:hypothetical protein